MESKLKTEKYGILQITERNINKYQNDAGIVFMDVLISCWIKILYDNLNKRVCHKS